MSKQIIVFSSPDRIQNIFLGILMAFTDNNCLQSTFIKLIKFQTNRIQTSALQISFYKLLKMVFLFNLPIDVLI